MILHYTMCRLSCAVTDDDTKTVILTGGTDLDSWKSAARYNRDGYIEDLPKLNFGRRSHACGSYLRNNERVKNEINKMYCTWSYIFLDIPSSRKWGF